MLDIEPLADVENDIRFGQNWIVDMPTADG
jgi:hypothetical protein